MFFIFIFKFIDYFYDGNGFVDCGFFRGKFIFINLFFRWIIFVVRRYFFVIFFFD